MNSLSTVTWEDFVSEAPAFKGISNKQQLTVIKIIGIIYGKMFLLQHTYMYVCLLRHFFGMFSCIFLSFNLTLYLSIICCYFILYGIVLYVLKLFNFILFQL